MLGLLTGLAVAHAIPALARTMSRGIGRSLSDIQRARTVTGFLVAAALVGTVTLDLAGLTRGEVERIWVPYAAWLIPAAALDSSHIRRWLAAQPATAIAVQALVHSPW